MSLDTEPALLIAGAGAIIEAVLVLLVSFGVPITDPQKAAINALVTLVVTLITGWLIRGQVTPTSKLTPVVTIPRMPPAG